MVTTAVKEVEKKAIKSEKEEKKSEEDVQPVEEKKDPDLLTLEDIKQQVHLIEKSVQLKDPRFAARVLRALTSTRKRLNVAVLTATINGYFTSQSPEKSRLLEFLPSSMETDTKPLGFQPRSAKSAAQPLLPEVSTYISLLLLVYLVDSKDYEKAMRWSNAVMDRLVLLNRRTLDSLQAKCYFYYARAHELGGQLESIRRLVCQHAFVKKTSE